MEKQGSMGLGRLLYLVRRACRYRAASGHHVSAPHARATRFTLAHVHPLTNLFLGNLNPASSQLV